MSKRKILHWIFLTGYCLFAIWLTIVSRRATFRRFQPELFWGLRLLLGGDSLGISVFIQYIGNIIFFIPIGFFISCISNGKSIIAVVYGLFFSASIETIQYITARGLAESDDIVSNTFGAVLGYIIWYFINKILGRIE